MLSVVGTTSLVFAGGYDTGERDWDFLFQEKRLAVEIGTKSISPSRRLGGIAGTLGPSSDTREAASFTLPRFSLASRLNDNVRCLLSYQEPYGGVADYGTDWTYSIAAVSQDFTSSDIGLTCAYSFAMTTGRASVIAGISRQTIAYELIQNIPLAGLANTNVSDDALVWRAGLAYEIPEYALRASLIYNPGGSFTPSGRVEIPGLFSGPVQGRLNMPNSVELRLQSGIADRTLAFGVINRTFWSGTNDMPLCPSAQGSCDFASSVSGLSLQWKDTTRVTAGLARQINDTLSLTGAVTWSEGATQGFTSQTDVLSFDIGAILSVSENAELRLGATIGQMASGRVDTRSLPGGVPNPVGYTATFGNDRVTSLRASLRFSF